LVGAAVIAVGPGATPPPASPTPSPIGAACAPDDTPCRVAAYAAAAETLGLSAAVAAFESAVDDTSVFHTDCHTISHTLGSIAYVQSGRNLPRSVATGSLECAGGMIHGALIRALVDQRAAGVNDLPAIARDCLSPELAATPQRSRECLHGLGHGIVAINTPIETAMRACDALDLPERPDAGQICSDGAIMEAFDPFVDGHATLLVGPDGDVMAPCLALTEEYYQARCAYYAIRQATRLDLSSGLSRCDPLSPAVRAACLRGVGADGWGAITIRPAEVSAACGDLRDPRACRQEIAAGAGEIVGALPRGAEAFCEALGDADCLGVMAAAAAAASGRPLDELCREATLSPPNERSCRRGRS